MAGTLTAATVVAATLDSGASSTPPVFKANNVEIGTLCRAWVQFGGSAPTIAASFNVGSITKVATGTFTINFTTAMPTTNYAVNVSAPQYQNNNGAVAAQVYNSAFTIGQSNKTAEGVTVIYTSYTYATYDPAEYYCSVFS
jgi:hypothetical protein